MERLGVIILLYSFFTTARLLSKNELKLCNDEEYIGMRSFLFVNVSFMYSYIQDPFLLSRRNWRVIVLVGPVRLPLLNTKKL